MKETCSTVPHVCKSGVEFHGGWNGKNMKKKFKRREGAECGQKFGKDMKLKGMESGTGVEEGV